MRPIRARLSADAAVVAPTLLGAQVVSTIGGERVVVRLTEVEAYGGVGEDPGSHAYRGRTARNSVMFGPAGHLYVYFTYGMHWCANVVTGRAGECNAVLLRAGEPVAGIDVMRGRRPTSRRDRDLAAGPARLTRALGITGADDGADLRRGPLRVLDDGVVPPADVAWTTRIGLAPGRGDDHPWRCVVAGSPFASRGINREVPGAGPPVA